MSVRYKRGDSLERVFTLLVQLNMVINKNRNIPACSRIYLCTATIR